VPRRLLPLLLVLMVMILGPWTDQGTTTTNNEKKVVSGVGKKKGSSAAAAAAAFGVDGDDVHAIFCFVVMCVRWKVKVV